VIHGTVLVEDLGIIPSVLVETMTEFDPKGELDNFSLDVFGVPMTVIKARGERHGIYLPCEIQVGPIFRQANLDAAASRLIGDAVRPFNFLPTLKVGQSWRMQVIDPLSAVMGGTTRFTPVIARVTGKETIQHVGDEEGEGKPVECFVVETSPGAAKAWVGLEGRVYKQQVDMPGLFGKLTVEDERYDEDRLEQARKRIRRTGGAEEDVARELGRKVQQLKTTISDVLGGDGHGRGN
jgi:hypothetical protein